MTQQEHTYAVIVAELHASSYVLDSKACRGGLGFESIYITENGCSCVETLVDGKVYDTDRIMFLQQYLSELARVLKDCVTVKGYFLWSLLDNLE